MRCSLYSIALLALPLLGPVLCDEPASPTQGLDVNNIYGSANDVFQDLLNALPEESLHVALNSLTKFKDGVFESGRHGVEHVHHDNPPLATKLIVAAVRDLKRRQQPASTNGTRPATTPPATSQPSSSRASPPPASSSKPADSAVIIPIQVTTTDSKGATTVVSSAFLSKATAFIPVDVTKTNAQGATVVTTETKPAVIFKTTDSAGSTFETASAVNFSPTAGEVLTATNDKGSTFLTTYTPDAGRVSSIVLVTTTGRDGRPMVVTSYTYVDPPAATQTNGQAAATGTQTVKPGLQTAAARKNIVLDMAVVGGAVGGAFVLFV